MKKSGNYVKAFVILYIYGIILALVGYEITHLILSFLFVLIEPIVHIVIWQAIKNKKI